MDKYIVAVCQMITTDVKQENIDKAQQFIREASKNGANIVVLPEMFNCPYGHQYFERFAEGLEGETVKMLGEEARLNQIYIIGGSIPEMDNGKIYNTCYAFDPDGLIIGKHRKIHLFDINVSGSISFKESDTLSPGTQVTIINTKYGKIGLAICYDIRFPELSRIMALEGAEIIVLPAAFNMTTGPAHWELSIRMRALDNQLYFIGAAPARNPQTDYVAYGHSIIANPWGEVITQAKEEETIIYATIDPKKIQSVRRELPLLKHRREDLYQLQYLMNK